MRGFVKFSAAALSAIVQASTFAIFGALAAFFSLAFSGSIPDAPKATSRALSDFLESKTESATFTTAELSEGIYSILLDGAKEKSSIDGRGTVLPQTPVVASVENGRVEICVPFAATFGGKSVLLGAFVSFGFDGKKISILYARVGRAKLPHFAAQKIAETLWSFYKPLGVDKKFGEKIETLRVCVDSNKKAVLKK